MGLTDQQTFSWLAKDIGDWPKVKLADARDARAEVRRLHAQRSVQRTSADTHTTQRISLSFDIALTLLTLRALHHIERDIDDHVLLAADHLAAARFGEDRAGINAVVCGCLFRVA
jgi:hypothetical protein